MPSVNEHPIVLVGLRGAGKSSVGILLAAKLGREFVDLDHELARAPQFSGIDHGQASAGEVLSTRGLVEFRARESAALEAVLAGSPAIVVAAGGGAVETPSNRLLLRDRAVCVWLRAAPEVLASRVDADPTPRPPLVPGGSLAEAGELAARRSAWYREVARLDIDSGVLTPREVASRVAAWLRRRS